MNTKRLFCVVLNFRRRACFIFIAGLSFLLVFMGQKAGPDPQRPVKQANKKGMKVKIKKM